MTGADDSASRSPGDGPTDDDDDPSLGDRFSSQVDRLRPTVRERVTVGDRAVIHKYLPYVAIAFLLVAAAGGVVAHEEHTAPEVETTTETAGTWTVDSEFDHGATVVNDTAVFAAGDRLENRPLYFTRLAPVLDGEYRLTHDGDAEPATGTVDVEIVVEATDEITGPDGEERTVTHWRETEPVATDDVEALDPGEVHTVTFDADVVALVDRIEAIEEELGASPGTTRISVVAESDIETEVADDRFVDGRTDRLELEPGGGTYEVEADTEGTGSYEATRTVEVPVESSPLRLYGGALLAVVGLLGAIATGVARREELFAVGDHERAHLEYRRTRSDMDKWISAGSVPDDDDRTVVELDSLRDLVDVAVDSDRRAIERADQRPRFVVLDDDVRYVYDPPPELLAPGRATPEGDDRTESDSPTPPTDGKTPWEDPTIADDGGPSQAATDGDGRRRDEP
ncbi:hypothetical protein JCM18237_22460 [Halorubrum luteum]